jgi:hypothetical protein
MVESEHMTPEDIESAISHLAGRFVTMWLLRTELGLGYTAIARLLCRDRKLVSYGVRKVDNLVLERDAETLRVLICARLMLRGKSKLEAAA